MKSTVVVNSSTLGAGSEELGERLIGSFLRKLWAEKVKPDVVVFYNSGVKLLAEGSSVLDALHALQGAGVDLVACGTCVDYFKLNGKVVVGRVSDMQEIVSLLMNSERVIGV
jgi:selenium metabolism protein YedF